MGSGQYTHCRGAVGLGRLACRGVGVLWRRVCRRDRVRLVGSGGAGRRRAPDAGGRVASLVLCGGHGGRDWLPARNLDGCRTAAGLARGLRDVAGRDGRSARSIPARRRDSLRACLVRVSRHRPVRARRHHARSPRGQGHCDRRRERSGEVDAREAAGKDVCAERWPHPRRFVRPRGHLRGGLARAGSPAPSRISSVSSSAPVRPSGSAICPAWSTSPRSSRP